LKRTWREREKERKEMQEYGKKRERRNRSDCVRSEERKKLYGENEGTV